MSTHTEQTFDVIVYLNVKLKSHYAYLYDKCQQFIPKHGTQIFLSNTYRSYSLPVKNVMQIFKESLQYYIYIHIYIHSALICNINIYIYLMQININLQYKYIYIYSLQMNAVNIES